MHGQRKKDKQTNLKNLAFQKEYWISGCIKKKKNKFLFIQQSLNLIKKTEQ